MIKLMLGTAGLALALLIVQPVALVRAQSQPLYSYNAADSRQHGYEHGYRDGADRGRQDLDRGMGRNFRDTDYLAGARDYDPTFGSKRDYMAGYQEGYKAGYDDGFNYYNRPGQYGQVFGRGGDPSSRGRSYDPSSRGRSYDPSSSGRGYNSSSRGPANQPATGPTSGRYDTSFDSGYREGIAAGQRDHQQNTRSDFRSSDSYRRGDTNFQDGVARGYQDGYGRSQYQTDGGGYFPNRGNTGPADTRDGVGTQSRTITVSSTQLWTPTSIRVNQGDRLQFQSSGEIQLGPANANSRASVAGSLTGRFEPNSPIPSALAGALIGRIDGGQPFGIGNQTSIVAPASGLLYLGINATPAGNSGQFQVVMSW